MEHPDPEVVQLKAHILNPNMKEPKCLDCGKQSYRWPKAIRMRGWWRRKSHGRILGYYCPNCGPAHDTSKVTTKEQ